MRVKPSYWVLYGSSVVIAFFLGSWCYVSYIQPGIFQRLNTDASKQVSESLIKGRREQASADCVALGHKRGEPGEATTEIMHISYFLYDSSRDSSEVYAQLPAAPAVCSDDKAIGEK